MEEYEDFYDNYSEFDLQINEFKKSLALGVKKEFLDRMEKLEEENRQLQNVRENWEDLVADYKYKEYELEQEKNNAKSEARKARLEELIDDRKIILYKYRVDYREKPKCNRCNSGRMIEYKSPSGKPVFEACECSTKDAIHSPEAYCWYEFNIDDYDQKLKIFYKKIKSSYGNHEYFEGDSFSIGGVYNKNMDYEDIKYNTFFETKEDCQKYCDWLNNKK